MSTLHYSTAADSSDSDVLGLDAVVCHCLKVTAAEIKTAASLIERPTAACVMNLTGAGGGCTACHRRIRQMISNQCPAASSSPIICAK